MSYLAKRGSVYYFRRVVPDDLRPILAKAEIMKSLRTKDREEAKRLIPAEIIQSDALFAEARKAPAVPSVQPKPSASQIERERKRWEHEQAEAAWQDEQAAKDDAEVEELAEYEQALAGDPIGARLLAEQREQIELARLQGEAQARALLEKGRASESQNQAIEYQGNSQPTGPGKGIYLDTDIVDGWAAERKPSPRGKDAYWRDAKLFNSMMGRKSVEQITKADVMAYKRLLIADPKRSQINVRDRLAYLRTLLEWAAQEDIIPSNPARDVKMAVSERGEKRADFNTDDLNALFAGPVHAKGERPKAGYGEAAYWLPLIALFMGARREEIGQLRVCDVKRVPYIDNADQRQEVWCIDITDTGDDDALPNQIKNEASNRLVPLHPKLIELGFIEYVEKLPDQAGRVFPDLKPIGIGMKLTDKWGQWFSRYKVACGITDKAKVFHSFRHTWKTHAVDAGIPERICRQFQGHEGKDAADKYGATPSMRVLVAAIASYRVPGLVLANND